MRLCAMLHWHRCAATYSFSKRTHHLRRLHLRPFSSFSPRPSSPLSFAPSFLFLLLFLFFPSLPSLPLAQNVASRSRSYPASRISLEKTEEQSDRVGGQRLLCSPPRPPLPRGALANLPIPRRSVHLYLQERVVTPSGSERADELHRPTRRASLPTIAPLLFTDPGNRSARQVTPPPFPPFPCLSPRDAQSKSWRDRPIAVVSMFTEERQKGCDPGKRSRVVTFVQLTLFQECVFLVKSHWIALLMKPETRFNRCE